MADDEHRVPLAGRHQAGPAGGQRAGRRARPARRTSLSATTSSTLGRPDRARARPPRRGHEAPVSVRELRGWIEAMSPPKGLREEVSDLVVLAWAALRGRAWFSYGAPIPTPAPGALRPEMEARIQPMPTPAEWSGAVTRAAALLGVHASPYPPPRRWPGWPPGSGEAVRGHLDDAARLVPVLEQAYARLGLPTDSPGGRLATARAAAQLTAQLRQLDGVDAGPPARRRRPGAGPAHRPLADHGGRGDRRPGGVPLGAAAAVGGVRGRRGRASRAGRPDPAAAAAPADRGRVRQLGPGRSAAGRGRVVRVAARRSSATRRRHRPRPRPPSPHSVGRQVLQAGEPADALLAELDAFRRRNPGQVVVEWRTAE